VRIRWRTVGLILLELAMLLLVAALLVAIWMPAIVGAPRPVR